MKRFISLFLCLLMLVGTLVACNTQPPVADDATTPGSVVTTPAPVTDAATTPPETAPVESGVDASEYTLVRPGTTSTAIMTALVEMKKAIDDATGGNMTFTGDSIKPGQENIEQAYEIIVGDTERPQSIDAKSRLVPNTFTIERIGNKIVIVGTDDNIIVEGINYFLANYLLPNAGQGKIALPEGIKYVSQEFATIDVVKDGKCRYNVIFDDKLDITANSNNGKIDYVAQQAQDIREKIKTLGDVSVTLKTDWARPGSDTTSIREILVGATDRVEYQQALEQYDIDEYGISFINNKIVIAGWNDTTIGMATTLFCNALTSATQTDANGAKSISLTATSNLRGKVSAWQTDVPAVEGATLAGSTSCANNDVMYYYVDASASEFTAYCKALESQGYKLYMENEMVGNTFATYTSADDSVMVHVYFVKYAGEIRVVTGSNTDKYKLPSNDREQYTKITETKITQMTLDYASGNFGMCYIVTLEDGSFIIFDGGGRAGGIDHIRLYNLLTKLNERPDGKIVIAAWILTHSHQDHYVVFYNFCVKYGKNVTIEQHISNVPDTVVRYNSGNPGGHLDDGTFDKAQASAGKFKLVKPYTGMQFWVRNAKIDVLYTCEAYFPNKLSIFNNSTMVTRMTIGDQTIMWLGDIQNEGSNVICDMYGNYIKSDIVQVAHHGSTGATKELYGLVDPAIAFWPTSSASFSNQIAGTATSGAYVVDHYLAKQLNVVDIFVAQPHNISITLPYTPGSGKEVKINVSAG